MQPFRQPAFLLAVLGLVACKPASVPSDAVALLDDDHAPQILVEQATVELPPALGSNRFLAGWWGWRSEGRPVLATIDATPARLQFVHLQDRPRTLVLDLLDGDWSVEAEVEVRAAGVDLGRVPVTDPLVISLPSGLPMGTVTVELVASADLKLNVEAARLRGPLPAGEVVRDGTDLLQSGDSQVGLIRPLTAGTEIVGSFVPPEVARAGQAFRLLLDSEDGPPREIFHWTASWWRSWQGPRPIRAVLPQAGLVRLRLVAEGKGPPARWQGLATVEPMNELVSTAPEVAPEARAERPQIVVLYVMDALRADIVGHLGGRPGVSPTLDRLAQEGFTFRGHRSVAPNTLPSTQALFTGRTPVQRDELGRADGPETLAEVFQRAGFRTALVSSNPYTSNAYGLRRGFDVAFEVPIPDPPGAIAFNDSAAQVHRVALDWLRDAPRDRPIFLYLHTLNPHNPYEPPEPYRSNALGPSTSTISGQTSTLVEIRRGERQVTEEDRQRLLKLYAAGLTYNDAELGTFLTELATLVPTRQTWLAVTSDHGEEVLEHGGVLHGYTLFDEMMEIPLVLWAPERIPAGAAIEGLTDSLDLHATLVDLAGEHSTGRGRSLLPLVYGEAPEPLAQPHFSAASSVEGGIFAARSTRWKVIYAPRTGVGWGTGQGAGRTRDAELVFDLEQDPEERVNRAGTAGLEAAWLRSRLLAWIEAGRRSAQPPSAAPEVDEETLKRLRSLGYVD